MASSKSNTSPLIIHDKQLLKSLDCSDPQKFQSVILRIRKFDDTIINILNSEIPTESFYTKSGIEPSKKCAQFNQEMHDYYDQRESAVKACIEKARKEVENLKQLGANVPLDQLKEKNYNLRVYQQELQIEKISRARTEKAVEERCRSYV